MRNSSTVSPIVRFMQFSLVVGVCVLAWVPAYAELQNVEVGGEIRLRGRFWRHTYAASFSSAPVQPFSGDFWGRTLGPWGFGSRFDWDDRGGDLRYWEQKTKLHVRADFTNDVSAAISIEACDIWGEDFRSEYVTGTDVRQAGSQTMEVSQGYIQANDMWDTPLDLRIGRQFIKLGKGWLVGDVISGTIPLFFDGVRATYDTDSFVVDAWWAKLDENSPAEEDGDEDFYGVAATYTGWDAFDLSAYWLWVRDAREVHDTEDGLIAEGLEEILGLDQYGDSNLHTLGVRLNGQEQSWDYDWELAYQFGDAAQRGRLFAPLMYGDDEAKNSGWATDLEIGYTFDVKWKPRVFVGGAYLSGSDDREFAPWGGHSSDAFHRMFSSLLYSLVLDVGQDMTNFNQIRVGVDARFTEKLSGHLQLAYFQVNDTTDLPLRYSFWGNTHALFPNWPFLTEESDSSLGTQAYGFLKYNYTEDFWVMLAWEHFFTDDGLTDGNFIYKNGMQFSGGTDTKDGDYITIDMGLKF